MKKVLFFVLALSVLSLGMAKKPATDPAEPAETKAVETSSKEAAPLFTLKDLNGKEVSLKEFKDKKAVLLVFWATWCVYCRQEIPDLIKLKEEYKDKNLEIFGVNIQESPSKVTPFVEKNKVNYTTLLDQKGEVARAYDVQGIPANVLIDKKGDVVFFGGFGKELKALIAEKVK